MEYPARSSTVESTAGSELYENTNRGEQVAAPEDGPPDSVQDHDSDNDVNENDSPDTGNEQVELQPPPEIRRSGQSRNSPDRYGNLRTIWTEQHLLHHLCLIKEGGV